MISLSRDHGGGLDAAVTRFGGSRDRWTDLSTGINPVPYPVPDLPADSWTALPDKGAMAALEQAARAFWTIPDGAAVLAMAGASGPIALIPRLAPAGTVDIPGPTYNEHAAAFVAAGWQVGSARASARVAVHPNNPDGRLWTAAMLPDDALTIIDESFCDVAPQASLIHLSTRPNTLVLKSFGKFWGLAGLRLGFVIGDPILIRHLHDMVGPWPVSGPALTIGTAALRDTDWASAARDRLKTDSRRLDDLMQSKGATPLGGTTLFRLYDTPDAKAVQTQLATSHLWSRIFPYSSTWVRLGLPAPDQWSKLENAL
ncbi:threonine-phosphate decarboxylase [Pseudogemmobacter sp. W21_MBD1_M6]|uniref:threonine-phosphate decarboxylase n=1 Tax=Pseudogemmobacter sp. W21_MBD1_M6 TaxID=3240271 RepID=UPI003F98E4CD